MYVAIYVLYSVIHDLMSVFARQSVIGFECIGVESRASSDMLANFLLQDALATAGNDRGADLPAALQDAHDCGFVFGASSGDSALAVR